MNNDPSAVGLEALQLHHAGAEVVRRVQAAVASPVLKSLVTMQVPCTGRGLGAPSHQPQPEPGGVGAGRSSPVICEGCGDFIDRQSTCRCYCCQATLCPGCYNEPSAGLCHYCDGWRWDDPDNKAGG